MTLSFVASPLVADALKNGDPVVALESTIITHGMPYPQNLETAQLVEATVVENGAVPATIAVIDGTLHVGLTSDQMQVLAQSTDAMKLSRADLTFAMALGRTGSTTVAATMMCAHIAGISTFATGGIGGVHRGVEDTWDISADLPEFSITPVTVVCAGAKAILDLPRTLEVLETNGVPVIAYGQDDFPAFWSRTSGMTAPLRSDDPANIAKVQQFRAKQPTPGGVLVANPIPKADEIPQSTINPWIEAALEKAMAKGIKGKKVTPFLLDEMLDQSGGASLKANVALIRNNAALAAQIAVAASNNG
ncbi:MAG: pseudouridine-5'-phosphate glycosidase [Planktomarina sp.]